MVSLYKHCFLLVIPRLQFGPSVAKLRISQRGKETGSIWLHLKSSTGEETAAVALSSLKVVVKREDPILGALEKVEAGVVGNQQTWSNLRTIAGKSIATIDPVMSLLNEVAKVCLPPTLVPKVLTMCRFIHI